MLPIALVVLAFAARNLKNVGETRSASLDIVSVVVSALGFGGLLYGFSRAGESGGSWTSAYVLVPLLLGVVSLGIFVFALLDQITR